MRLALARTVWGVHTAVFAFIVVAWALPWSWALWTAVIGYPLVRLNWWLCDNRCFLTVLEEKLRGPQLEIRAGPSESGEDQLNFAADLISRALGRPVPVDFADRLSYGFVYGGFAIALLRLVFRAHV